MTENKTYTLEELDAMDSPAIDAETANTYSVEDLDKLDSWSSGSEVLKNTAISFGKGLALDIARIPNEIGQLIKEQGEKGGAGMGIPSFQDGVNIANFLTGKDVKLGPQDEMMIKAGEMLSKKNDEFINRLNLKPEDGSKLSQIAFDIGQGASSVATSLGLLYATRSPSLLFGLFGLRQKAQIYQEARDAGKDPETASALSSAAGLVEGGVEAIGGMAFLKAASFDKFLTRSILRVVEQGVEEGLQQSGEEGITHLSGVRKDSLKDSLLRIGYASALGMVIGVPAGAISSAFEKTKIRKELADIGLSKEQSEKIIKHISENVAEDASVKQEVLKFLEEEVKNTEAAINENPNYSTPEEDLAPEDTQTEAPKPEEVKPKETNPETPSDIQNTKTGDTSFDFGELYNATLLPESERKAIEANLQKELLQEQLNFREKVGKFRKYSKNFLEQEMSDIPRRYFTNDPNAMDLDEKAQSLGYDSGEELRQAIKTFESIRPGAEMKLKEINQFLREYEKTSRKESKQNAAFLKRISDVLSQGVPSKDVKGLVRENTGQVDYAPKKYTEMQALRGSLQQQARAAVQAERATKKDLKSLKSGLVDSIKQIIPPSGQGKFLTAIANAEDGRDIAEIAVRAEDLANTMQKKELVKAIKKQVARIKASKSIAVEYVEKIKDLVDSFDLQDRQSDTLIRLMETQRFLDEQSKLGEDVSAPQYVLDQLKILGRQPLASIDNATLANLLNTIGVLADIGKTKLIAREAIDEALKAKDLNDLLHGSKPLKTRTILQPNIGEELSAEEARKNTFSKIINTAMHLDLSITPMDVIFDMLDGNQSYQGPNYRIFKSAVDQAYSNYLEKKFSYQEPVIKLAEDLNLTDADFEKIGFFAARMQEGGTEKLETLGYTQEQIDSVNLDEKQMKFYNAARRALDKIRPEIAETMRTVYNENLGTVKNYFPFMTDFESMSDLEMNERFGNNVQEFGKAPTKNVAKGFTKERVGGKQKIKLHAMQIFMNHIDNAAYLVTVGQHTKRLGEIAKMDEYKVAVGDKGQEIVVNWVDTMARKGRMAGERVGALDILRKNVGLATLGFKLSSILVQPTSLLDGASLIGTEVFEGAKNIATSQEWRDFIVNNMPEVKARLGDDPSFREFGGNSLIDKTGQKAFWALQEMDALTASSVAAGAYIKYMNSIGETVDLQNPNPEAINYAQRMMRRTQASAFFKDSPQAITRGALTGNQSVDRLILQFQTFLLNRWSLIRHEGYQLGFKGGNIQQGVNVMAFMVLANIAEMGFRGLSKELLALLTGSDVPEEKDGFTERLFKELLDNVPWISPIMNAFSYGSIPIPAIQFMRTAFDRLSALSKSKKPETKAKNAARSVLLLSGLFGVPGTVQADQLIGKIGKKNKKKVRF